MRRTSVLHRGVCITNFDRAATRAPGQRVSATQDVVTRRRNQAHHFGGQMWRNLEFAQGRLEMVRNGVEVCITKAALHQMSMAGTKVLPGVFRRTTEDRRQKGNLL